MRGRLRWVSAGLGVFLCVGPTSLSALAAHPTSEQSRIPPKVRAILLNDALDAAARNGDEHPYDIEAVRTTKKEADRLQHTSESEPVASRPAYLLAMRGHFNCDACSPPAGVTIHERSVITMQIEIGSMKETTVTDGNHYPDLSEVGVPIRLRRRART
jgi:hypothetical protein